MDFSKIEIAVADAIREQKRSGSSKVDPIEFFPKIIRAAFEAYEAEKQETP